MNYKMLINQTEGKLSRSDKKILKKAEKTHKHCRYLWNRSLGEDEKKGLVTGLVVYIFLIAAKAVASLRKTMNRIP